MKALMRLIEVLEQKPGKKILIHEIGYETICLMHDEIVSLSIILILAEPVVCDSANYTDDEGNYYTLGFIKVILDGEILGHKKYVKWFINYDQ